MDPGGSNTAYCHHGNCTDGHKLGEGTGAGGGNISKKTYDPQAEAKAVQRAKATANAAAAAAKKQVSGLKHQLLSLVADVIGLTDAYNCFTKGDVMGCVNTALTAVPWGKVFKAIKVGVEAFKIWRALDRAYTAVKDAEEAARLAEDAVRAEHAMAEMRAAENAGADTAEGVACTVHSFVPGTGVRLADGTSKPISKVKVGDTVLATDPQTRVTAPEKVQGVIVTKTDRDFTTLTLDTAPVRGPPHRKSEQQTLTTTWHHPFWDATHHRWVDAHDLTPGTELRTADGTTVTVTGVHNFHQRQVTYDLTVAELHTYYVLAGATPVLVHNCGGPVSLSDEQIDTHILPRHGPGSPATGSKFSDDVDPDDFEDMANEVVSGSPMPTKVDPVTGNHAHEHDLGRVVGENGETKVRVWVDEAGNVRTMHPVR